MDTGTIGARIKQYREALGLSQAELAEGLGVSRPTITHWESGRRAMDAMNLLNAAVLLGVSPGDLVQGADKPGWQSQDDRIRALIRAEGPHLAARWLEVDPSAIQAVVNGKLRIDPACIARIAQSYRVNPVWLVTGKRKAWSPSLKGRPGERLRFLRVVTGIPVPHELADYWPSLEANDELFREEQKKADSVLNAVIAPMLSALIALDEFSLRGLRNDPEAPSMYGWDWVLAEGLD